MTRTMAYVLRVVKAYRRDGSEPSSRLHRGVGWGTFGPMTDTPPTKKTITIALSPEDQSLVEDLKTRYGISTTTDILRAGIRALSREISARDPRTERG